MRCKSLSGVTIKRLSRKAKGKKGLKKGKGQHGQRAVRKAPPNAGTQRMEENAGYETGLLGRGKKTGRPVRMGGGEVPRGKIFQKLTIFPSARAAKSEERLRPARLKIR